ncbi:hypothetical protein LTR67_011086 [Exophiala xenobiotica]
MTQSQALVLEAAGGEFAYSTIKLKPLQPREVLVRLKATGLCHTDIAVQQGKIPAPFPVVLGHEGAGVVKQVERIAIRLRIQTGAGAVFNVIKPVKKEVRSLVVFGIGGVGSASLMAAKYLSTKASGILDVMIAVDRDDRRLTLAKQLGATHTINATDTDYHESIAQICGGRGVDAAIDCTGSVQVINDMIVALAPCGTAVTVGAPLAMSRMSIEVFPFINGCKTYRGTHAGNSVAKTVSLKPSQHCAV